MKYGITQWSFPNGLFAFDFAKEAGFDGVQIESGLETTGYYLRDRTMQTLYQEKAKACGLEIISVVDNDMMHVGCQGDKNQAEYKQSIRAIDYTIETAVAIGCERIMLPMFFRSQIISGRQETFDRAVEVLQYTCDCAQEEGLLVQVETCISAKEQKELLRLVNRANLVNYYDSQNLYWYDGLDAVQELKELMPVNGPEMHVCDGWGLMIPQTNGGKLLGTGEAHFEEQMKIICEFGWDGWLIAENGYHLPSLRNEGGYLELAKRDLAAMKNAVAKYSH